MQGNDSKTTQYLTTEEVADRLRVHWQTVLDLIRSGMLVAAKVGKSYRINSSDLEAFISSHSTSGAFRYKELFEERAKDISKSSQFAQTRLFVVSCSFLGVNSIPELFRSATEGVGKTINNPSRIREMGWHIDPLMNEYPKPVSGNYLEYTDRARCLRVYKDGHVIAAAVMGGNFLGWGVNDRDEEAEDKSINALAVAEFIANFFIKAQQISKHMTPAPVEALISGYVSNPRVNKLDMQYNGPSFFSPSQIGESFQNKEAWLDSQIIKMAGPTASLKAAAFLWKEFCHAFGIYDAEVPLLTADKEEVDVEGIKRRA